jgi:uncharacterized OB-fold protein
MSLLERPQGAPGAMPGELPVTSRYTFGLGGERFFRALKDEGRILGAHCPKCDVTYVPGRAFCERCLGELSDWRDVGLRGTVHTYTLLHEGLDGRRAETPTLVAFVRLGDGGLVHYLGDVHPDRVAIGMPVEAVLKPAAERTGGILDIAYFRPI